MFFPSSGFPVMTRWLRMSVKKHCAASSSYVLFYLKSQVFLTGLLWFLARVFCLYWHYLWVWRPHIQPQLHRGGGRGGLNLLTESSELMTLEYPSFHEKLCEGLDQPWFCLWGATTSHATPVNKYSTRNCGKGEC